MKPSLAYSGPHERDTVDPDGITIRFLNVLAEAGFDREQLGQCEPRPGAPARPFSATASGILLYNVSTPDLFMEG